MTRLFIATGIFHPESGGPATYLYELLPQLQARGWDVRVLCYGNDSTAGYPYPLTRIPRNALPKRLLQYAQVGRSHLQWADLTYMHTLTLPLIGHRAPRVLKIVGDQAWERSIRRGWIAPTEDIDAFQTRGYGPLVTAQKAARSYEVRGMDGVIVPSEYLKRMVMGWGVPAEKIQVIYNALPQGHLPASVSQAEARSRLGLDNTPTLLTAARLQAWKGVDHLISALQHGPYMRLLVAGDGPLRAQWTAQTQAAGLSDRVHFLGQVPREKMALYMKAADYFALYSGYEGLSHVLLESLRAGTPVIASDKGGNPEVVQDGKNGFLVPYVNVEALRHTLNTAVQRGQREALAAQSHLGMERFAFDHMVAQTDTALRRFLP